MNELGIKRNKKIKVIFCAYRDWAINVVDSYEKSDVVEIVEVIQSKTEFDNYFESEIKNSIDCIVLIGWSWIVEDRILDKYMVVGMHPSDLPDYRGGSPIQHQIINGLKNTKISLMTIAKEEIDVGDIWAKEEWNLEGSTMKEVLEKLTISTIKLLNFFFTRWGEIQPVKQKINEGSYYKRRRPEESKVTWEELDNMGLENAYNFIRCLSEPYPNAYIEDSAGNILKIKEVEFIKAVR